MKNEYYTISFNHNPYEHIKIFNAICTAYDIGTCIYCDKNNKITPIIVFDRQRYFGTQFNSFELAFGDMIAFIGDKISQSNKEYDIELIKYLDELSEKFINYGQTITNTLRQGN